MGIKVCSDTSTAMVVMCRMLLSMYRGGMAMSDKTMGIIVNICPDILKGIGVSLYQVSACICGCQQIPCIFGPNAMDLETSHVQIRAERTKRNLISLFFECVNRCE